MEILKKESNKIIRKEELAPLNKLFEIKQPNIARKAVPGQFIVIIHSENGERIPLTIADTNKVKGTITIIFQEVGKSTMQLGTFKEGDRLQDVVGPLGKPTEIEHYGTVVCIGGGVGIAPLYPITKALKEEGNKVIGILGARTKELLILEKEFEEITDELYITTDDGSYGRKGFVSDELSRLIGEDYKIARVWAIGPAIMMKVVSEVTRPQNIKTIVSLNPIMVDGTGMCGCCRVEVGGETKFACVDGPEFDGHLVDFDLLMKRQAMYKREEKLALESYIQSKRGK
ncbi:ferredoxin-NADP reductase [candidate division WOR-3 bacterium JGI_Cruoil_03_44_89]|uniref:Ferredoxin-NADP reductase n=1 Tax=candidate division WOR-3 bacterium JGI_Cruoil_03_44_89 TaxID=1973748 RepID=A0A235BRG3_UNCW3|nr:MAG: ferredoxin-NADP reductase [candidate division WOR-3 bacterium JGI_Cruoil_03_44_89]